MYGFAIHIALVGFLAAPAPSQHPALDLEAAGVRLLSLSAGFTTDTIPLSQADLIVPRGWGMPFWLPLVHAGARVGGTREEQNAHFEMGYCVCARLT